MQWSLPTRRTAGRAAGAAVSDHGKCFEARGTRGYLSFKEIYTDTMKEPRLL